MENHTITAFADDTAILSTYKYPTIQKWHFLINQTKSEHVTFTTLYMVPQYPENQTLNI